MEDQAAGWDAIESAVEATVPAQEPLHWGTDNLPGQGIYGLSAYRGDGCVPLTDTPPPWALNLLKKLGDYVFSGGRVFAPGHQMA